MLSCILDQVCTHACDVLKLKQHPTSQYDNSILTVHFLTIYLLLQPLLASYTLQVLRSSSFLLTSPIQKNLYRQLPGSYSNSSQSILLSTLHIAKSSYLPVSPTSA